MHFIEVQGLSKKEKGLIPTGEEVVDAMIQIYSKIKHGLNSSLTVHHFVWMLSEVYKAHAKHLVDSHDQLLQTTLDSGSYNKLYSFKHIVNGFSVHTTPSQVSFLSPLLQTFIFLSYTEKGLTISRVQ